MTAQTPSAVPHTVIKIGITVIAALWIAGAGRYYWDDRIAQDPQCASLAHTLLYRSETLAKRANQCVGDLKLREATVLAEAALKRQPFNQLALAALGSVADLEGDQKGADAWMRAASLLGHRDYSVETYWLERASFSQDPFQQAQRLDALFRAGWANDVLAEEVRTLEASSAGRRALLPLVSKTSPWTKAFLTNVGQLSDQQLMSRRALFLDAMHAKQGSGGAQVLDLATASPAISELQRRGLSDEALLLRGAFKPFSRKSFVNDSQFALADKNNGPFDWKLIASPGLEASLLKNGSRSAGLHVRTDAPGRYEIAQQVIQLPAGSYRVQATGRANMGESAAGAKLVVNLVSSTDKSHLETLALPVPVANRLSSVSFDVPSAKRYYLLVLSLDTLDSAQAVDIDLTSVMIARDGGAQ
ncbi:hypothetical protein [Sphingobium sp. CECT 9361]|uniref:hypothetical protein n=1 Tax=Sphingobium sp. CECT 9361 TaxID=2845384 RepID=UPI001E2A4D66|nr:hypothetical protein [Sphingobium sp. CECT 9361]CAH0356440.1 hypothetical protein SPH9361_04084 [Sphingobium sp. CECT 9361]